MRPLFWVIVGTVAGYVLSEFITAGLSYFGFNLGKSILTAVDPNYETTQETREFAEDIYLAARRSPVPIPSSEVSMTGDSSTSCIAWRGMSGEQGLRNLYALRYKSIGLDAPDIENSRCVEVEIGETSESSSKKATVGLFVRPSDGPTCRLGTCAIDLWLYEDGKLILSVRARKIGLAMTSTKGFQDIVADDYYVFTWDGSAYRPRYF